MRLGSWLVAAMVLLVMGAGVVIADEAEGPDRVALPAARWLFPVLIDGKWGVIDEAGETVIPPRYDQVALLSERHMDAYGYPTQGRWNPMLTPGANHLQAVGDYTWTPRMVVCQVSAGRPPEEWRTEADMALMHYHDSSGRFLFARRAWPLDLTGISGDLIFTRPHPTLGWQILTDEIRRLPEGVTGVAADGWMFRETADGKSGISPDGRPFDQLYAARGRVVYRQAAPGEVRVQDVDGRPLLDESLATYRIGNSERDFPVAHIGDRHAVLRTRSGRSYVVVHDLAVVRELSDVAISPRYSPGEEKASSPVVYLDQLLIATRDEVRVYAADAADFRAVSQSDLGLERIISMYTRQGRVFIHGLDPRGRHWTLMLAPDLTLLARIEDAIKGARHFDEDGYTVYETRTGNWGVLDGRGAVIATGGKDFNDGFFAWQRTPDTIAEYLRLKAKLDPVAADILKREGLKWESPNPPQNYVTEVVPVHYLGRERSGLPQDLAVLQVISERVRGAGTVGEMRVLAADGSTVAKLNCWLYRYHGAVSYNRGFVCFRTSGGQTRFHAYRLPGFEPVVVDAESVVWPLGQQYLAIRYGDGRVGYMRAGGSWLWEPRK